MSASYVIVGDGIAGSSAAETLFEAAPDADITVLTDEGEPLYNRILTKEYAKGRLPEAPIAIHDERWYDERDIDLRLNTLVTEVDTDANAVRTHGGERIAYDKLLIAIGGTPSQLPVENADAEGVHHFWTFEDARAIRAAAEAADTGVVVGAGLLGIDFAAICGAHDIVAHYLMRGDRWWRYALTAEGAGIIHDALRRIGVTPVFESGVARFETDDDGRVTAAIDPNGDRYACDWAGVAIGLDLNTEILQGTAVECDDGVVVDEHMQTSAEDVYAAGDLTRFYDTILDDYARNGSWGSAKAQGAVAARNMVAPGSEAFRWVSSYSITHFDVPVLSFGHPTIGETHAERRYGETEWRRLAFVDGRIVGGVLIGDLSPQSAYKRLMREECRVAHRADRLLKKRVDAEEFLPREG